MSDFRHIVNAIPPGGRIDLSIERANEDEITIILNRHFPESKTSLVPLLLTGTIDEFEKDLSGIISDYSRTTDMSLRDQAEASLRANEAQQAQSASSTAKTDKKADTPPKGGAEGAAEEEDEEGGGDFATMFDSDKD